MIEASLLDSAHILLCAPTGKTAQRLQEKTGLPASTIHTALGIRPDSDFLCVGTWDAVKLIVIDEASMMTLGMFSAILARASADCRIVLVGDPDQLPAVGAGNVMEWLEIGMKHISQNRSHISNLIDRP